MMDVNRRNGIIAGRSAPATEVELRAVSDWLAECFSQTRHGGDDERWAVLFAWIDELMRAEPDYPGWP